MLIVAVCSAIVVVALAFGVVNMREIMGGSKHQRTLANIARMERELGIAAPTTDDIADLGQRIQSATWLHEDVTAPHLYDARPDDRIYGFCSECSRRVAFNAGRCQVPSRGCAKVAWRREQADRPRRG